MEGLAESVQCLKDAGCHDLVLLKCTSTYPSTPANTNLNTIPNLRSLFHCEVGLSDHTMGVGVSVASVALGATVIEKHFTLDRSEGGVDSAFSMEPHELRSLVAETKNAWQALGEIKYGILEAEKNSLNFKRSIYIAEDIKAGEVFTEKNVRVIRPGKGLHPRYYEEILGKTAHTDLAKGQPFTFQMLT